jgi:hypothetical protein
VLTGVALAGGQRRRGTNVLEEFGKQPVRVGDGHHQEVVDDAAQSGDPAQGARVDSIAQANRDCLCGHPALGRPREQAAAFRAAEDRAEANHLGTLDVGRSETPVGGHGPDHQHVAVAREVAEALSGPQ